MDFYIKIIILINNRIRGSVSLTKGKTYEVQKEGGFYNPSNSFRTRFSMIFIKDDNGRVWGLDEELFDMTNQYSSGGDLVIDKTGANQEEFNDKLTRTNNDYRTKSESSFSFPLFLITVVTIAILLAIAIFNGVSSFKKGFFDFKVKVQKQEKVE